MVAASAHARGIAGRNLFKPDQIRAPDDGIFMDAIQMRLVPKPSALQFVGPTGTTCTQMAAVAAAK
jgi:hypothetical protein